MIKAFIKTVLGFAFPSWAVWLLIGTVILGAIGTIYAKGRLDQFHKDEIARLSTELAQERENNRRLAEHITRLQKAAKDDAVEKAKDDATIAELESRFTDLAEKLSDPDRECFSADDIDGLLGIWGKGKGQSRPDHHPRR